MYIYIYIISLSLPMYGEEVPTLPIQGGLSSSLISKWVITHCTRDKT